MRISTISIIWMSILCRIRCHILTLDYLKRKQNIIKQNVLKVNKLSERQKYTSVVWGFYRNDCIVYCIRRVIYRKKSLNCNQVNIELNWIKCVKHQLNLNMFYIPGHYYGLAFFRPVHFCTVHCKNGCLDIIN